MSVASNKKDSYSHSPPKVRRGRPRVKRENMLTASEKKLFSLSRSDETEKFVISFKGGLTCKEPVYSQCEKRKRDEYEDLYVKDEVRSAVMEQAKDVQANLSPEFPSFIKCMLPSHVTGGFWLGLPKKFCLHHLPTKDKTITLEDESGEEYETKYLAGKIGLSGGWRRFSVVHKLVKGDVLVFHLVRPSKFKVYIVRSKGSEDVDGALSLLQLDTSNRQMDSENFINICEEEVDKYWEPLARDIPEENFKRDNCMMNSTVIQPVSEQSEDDSKDPTSEVLDGIKFCESIVDFKEVKCIENFSVVVGDLVIDSALSQHLKSKYYELCCSQNSFLHDSLLDGLNIKLIAGMISETINIADAIRASKLTTPENNFAIWDKTLKAFTMMGMKVGFLQMRLNQLMNLAAKSSRYQDVRLELARSEEEKRMLELKLSEATERIDKLNSEMESLQVNPDDLDIMFQEVAKAPW